jgi:hypothetical protein
VSVNPLPIFLDGTPDDVVLRVTGETVWDDVDKQPVYKYSKRWTVPEGL